MISNRGTKIYPGVVPDILLVDCFRSRWIADAPLSNDDVLEFLKNFPKEYTWVHIEKLHKEGETPMYSKAQGE